jgi:hypothetical protein
MPLHVSIKDDRLTISVGIRTLAQAMERMEENWPFNEATNRFEKQVHVQRM